jgi:hypothetical protein
MKSFSVVFSLAIIASATSGCSSENVVNDSDRVVVEYNRQMWEQTAVLASTISSSAPDAAVALATLVADGTAAADHMVKIWGAPKVAPPPYTKANLKLAMSQSEKAHASIWLHPMAIAGYAAMALLAGLKVAGSFFPGVGTFVSSAAGQALKTVAGAVVDMKQRADSHPQDTIHLSDIQETISDLRQNPTIDGLLKKAHVDTLVESGIAATSEAPKS